MMAFDSSRRPGAISPAVMVDVGVCVGGRRPFLNPFAPARCMVPRPDPNTKGERLMGVSGNGSDIKLFVKKSLLEWPRS
jgi:hypothetical protein